MECFQVFEAGEGIEAAILRGLSARGGLRARCSSGNHPALLVVSPRAAEQGLKLSGECCCPGRPAGRRCPSGRPAR